MSNWERHMIKFIITVMYFSASIAEKWLEFIPVKFYQCPKGLRSPAISNRAFGKAKQSLIISHPRFPQCSKSFPPGFHHGRGKVARNPTPPHPTPHPIPSPVCLRVAATNPPPLPWTIMNKTSSNFLKLLKELWTGVRRACSAGNIWNFRSSKMQCDLKHCEGCRSPVDWRVRPGLNVAICMRRIIRQIWIKC